MLGQFWEDHRRQADDLSRLRPVCEPALTTGGLASFHGRDLRDCAPAARPETLRQFVPQRKRSAHTIHYGKSGNGPAPRGLAYEGGLCNAHRRIGRAKINI
jgi:hypothetical protein